MDIPSAPGIYFAHLAFPKARYSPNPVFLKPVFLKKES